MARGRPAVGRIGALLVAAALLVLTASLARAAAPKPGPWVGLGSGRIGDYEWSVKVRRPGGPAGAGSAGGQRPCLLVGATWPVGRYSYGRIKARQCAGGSGRLAATEPPLIASGAQPSHGSSAKMTAVGMVLAPAASRVQVTFPNGKTTTIHLKSLNATQARKAGLGRLRYAALVVRGTWCAERLVSQDAAGRTLWDSGTDGYACSSGGRAIGSSRSRRS